MNNQQAFDKMVTHLFTQKKQALTNGQCQYKTADGLQCAVGALISDADYNEEFEGQPVHDIIYSIPDLVHLDIDILTRAQCIHDEYAPKDWFRELSNTCALFNLDYTILKTFEWVEL